jgi:DNA repair photolyase
METLLTEAKSILTPQKTGFLAAGPYPFTHTLSAYLGCGFGQAACGLYCYAQFLPSWSFRSPAAAWGGAVEVKTNAARLLEQALAAMKPAVRRRLRILMSGATDPYQPLERHRQLTSQCLEVFARYPDLDLLLVQTRSPLAERDVPVLQHIPYAWLSVTIETDDQAYLRGLRGGPLLSKRWELVRRASEAGIRTQIAVSPCLAYSGVETFEQRLLRSGAQRLIVDSLLAGDRADGRRIARSPFAQVEPDWAKTAHAQRLYHYLREKAEGTGIAVGWSCAGFSGIPPRRLTPAEATVLDLF